MTMAKYRVHVFETIRRAYEVEADSSQAACHYVANHWANMTPVLSECTGELTDDVLVDPLLQSGEVDFDNAKWFELSEETDVDAITSYYEDRASSGLAALAK